MIQPGHLGRGAASVEQTVRQGIQPGGQRHVGRPEPANAYAPIEVIPLRSSSRSAVTSANAPPAMAVTPAEWSGFGGIRHRHKLGDILAVKDAVHGGMPRVGGRDGIRPEQVTAGEGGLVVRSRAAGAFPRSARRHGAACRRRIRPRPANRCRQAASRFSNAVLASENAPNPIKSLEVKVMDLSAEQPLKVPSASVLPGEGDRRKARTAGEHLLADGCPLAEDHIGRPVQSEKMLFPATRSSVVDLGR